MPDSAARNSVIQDAVTPDTGLKHRYHAEATALKGSLVMPLEHTIAPQATLSLDPEGGYLSPPPAGFRSQSVISYASAYTQVAGIEGTKQCKGYATLATAVVEGLNILEILTCDRVVSQIATHHPVKGDTPEIVFLGTRFDNLRIAGHPVHVTLDIDTIGPKPLDDMHYLDQACFLARVAKHCKEIQSYGTLPLPARERYTGLQKTAGNKRFIDFSLVTKISGDYPGRSLGHIIHVPHFGTIDLATVRITCEKGRKTASKTPPKTTVELKMLEVKLGCIGHGDGDVAFCKTNGGKGP